MRLPRLLLAAQCCGRSTESVPLTRRGRRGRPWPGARVARAVAQKGAGDAKAITLRPHRVSADANGTVLALARRGGFGLIRK